MAYLHHPPIFMLDALPVATIQLYPGLGQAPNMLAVKMMVLLMTLIVNVTV